jgi:predicted phosphodiesterase
MLVGVISDTHGLLRPEAIDALRGSAIIIHAGDVGKAAVLERLRRHFSPSMEKRAGVLYLNPGSAGPRRFRLPTTLARLAVSSACLEPEIIALPVGQT